MTDTESEDESSDESSSSSTSDEDEPKPKGVSVIYLLDIFPSDAAKAAGGKKEPNFNDLTHKLFGPEGKGASKPCPRDGKPGCSFVDALHSDYRKTATHFVSWCWSYSVSDFIGAIGSWTGRTCGKDVDKKKGIFLWICFFCNNQYRLLAKGVPKPSSEDLLEVFGKTLQSIGKALVIFDSFRDPTYIQRAWCVFECFTIVKEKIEVELILPESAQAQFHQTIRKEGTEEFIIAYHSLDCRIAQASNPEDEKAIMELIQKDHGTDEVNKVVKDQLCAWATHEFTLSFKKKY